MIALAQRHVGQAGARASAGPATIDKWSLIDALTQAAQSFGIGHRQIGVLRSLITFHPQRFWPVTADSLIVFPSNRTLSDRLGGMPDSTLRRHLNTLVSAGLITRRASSNGKRYRRGRGAQEIAFGLDLAPLVQLAAKIGQAARAAQEHAERIAVQRAQLLALQHDLKAQDANTHAIFLADLGRALRRKLGLDEIAALIKAATKRLSAVLHTPLAPREMSASDTQNERHKDPEKRKLKEKNTSISVAEINELCTERASLFPDPMRSWSDVTRCATSIAPMVGIDGKTLDNAKNKVGAETTAVFVLYILEVLPRVERPGAYLHYLVSRNNALSEVISTFRKLGLSADKSERCFNSVI